MYKEGFNDNNVKSNIFQEQQFVPKSKIKYHVIKN